MAKLPAKVSVGCPHCGFEQLEYAAARTTICRQCSSHYTLHLPKPGKLVVTPAAEPAPVAVSAERPSLFERIESLWQRRGPEIVECFDCKTKQEVSASAKSTSCPGCGAYIDVQDYKITTSFSRNIRTRGAIHLTPKGELSSSSVICNSALIEGKLRGSLQCDGEVRVNFVGKVLGSLSGHKVVVEKKSDLQFFRQVKAGCIEIKGRMTGEVVADGLVTIGKTGALDGNVTARSINVEKGGKFSGQLIIGQKPLHQGELLPENEAVGRATAAKRLPGPRALGTRALPASS